ncbi:Arc family DNA binding domain-containing protein [Carboxylicivirga sp. A043]|uniref:Arc family DNA binding domain-containing protein n=1 Tax=Carboxylicivirga litoralis TaxID=2816963 RepID=UPI0021CB5EBC|nr:Arc family DNA binding domain-containing protein [Carboxylicivirga sp. A043]MCU4154766.1 Arc family DNA binding domain-containing protein [Carboxylicivirga sp. A043]
MSKKKSFVLRIDPETFRQIEKWADDEFRSVNGQLEWMIHKCLKDAHRLKTIKKTDESGDKAESQ